MAAIRLTSGSAATSLYIDTGASGTPSASIARIVPEVPSTEIAAISEKAHSPRRSSRTLAHRIPPDPPDSSWQIFRRPFRRGHRGLSLGDDHAVAVHRYRAYARGPTSIPIAASIARSTHSRQRLPILLSIPVDEGIDIALAQRDNQFIGAESRAVTSPRQRAIGSTAATASRWTSTPRPGTRMMRGSPIPFRVARAKSGVERFPIGEREHAGSEKHHMVGIERALERMRKLMRSVCGRVDRNIVRQPVARAFHNACESFRHRTPGTAHIAPERPVTRQAVPRRIDAFAGHHKPVIAEYGHIVAGLEPSGHRMSERNSRPRIRNERPREWSEKWGEHPFGRRLALPRRSCRRNGHGPRPGAA